MRRAAQVTKRLLKLHPILIETLTVLRQFLFQPRRRFCSCLSELPPHFCFLTQNRDFITFFECELLSALSHPYQAE
jgi:hypothetical protein